MKKIFVLICVFSLVFCSSAFGVENLENNDYVGFLTRLKTTPEEFFMMMKKAWATQGWVIEGGDHSTSKARFYDSLMLMQMALNAGEVDEMILPDFVAEYLLKINKNYEPCCISDSGPMSLSFGFLKENWQLKERWNAALISMRDDFTLAGFYQKYVKDFPKDTSYDYIYGENKNTKNKNTIKFERFKDAKTIKVAVTGDLPPVDFVGEDGMPAGYSTAVLAEIGKRLRVNIQLVQVNAGARTAALVSGRVDVVFWYEVNKSFTSQHDVNEDIILSEPYLSWNKFMHLKILED